MQIRLAAAVVASAAAGAVALLVGCTATPASRPPALVTIGLVADSTRDDNPDGADAARGAQLAVSLINEEHPEIQLPLAAGSGLPGLGGAPLSLAVGDTGGRPGQAEATVTELLAANRAVALVVTDRADVVTVAGAYADRRQVPIVDGRSTAGYLTEVGLAWYFRTTPTDRALGEAVFGLLRTVTDRGAARRVTVLTSPEDRGADVAAVLRDLARANGFTLADTVAAGPDRTDTVARLAASEPDIVIAVVPEGSDPEAVRQAVLEWGWSGPLIGVGRGFDTSANGHPDSLLRATSWSAELADRQPIAQAVNELYRSRFNQDLTYTAAGAFTAVMTLATAIDAAGATDPARVRAALRQLSIPATETIMPWNGVRFDESGQNELAQAVVEQRLDDHFRLVYPGAIAVVDPVWPTPATGDWP